MLSPYKKVKYFFSFSLHYAFLVPSEGGQRRWAPPDYKSLGYPNCSESTGRLEDRIPLLGNDKSNLDSYSDLSTQSLIKPALQQMNPASSDMQKKASTSHKQHFSYLFS